MRSLELKNPDSISLIGIAVLAILVAFLYVKITAAAIVLGIVLPVALVIIAVYLRRPELFVYSMFFLAPFHFYVTDRLLSTPTLAGPLSLGGLYQDIWPIGLVGIWLFHSYSAGRLTVSKPPAALAIILLGIWGILHVYSIAPLTGALFGLRNLLRYAVLPFLVPVLLTTSRQLRGVFLSGMVGMTLAVILSLNEAPVFIAWAVSEVGINLAALPADLRFVGIFRSAGQTATTVSNSFGIAISLYAAYSVGRAFETERMTKRVLLLLCTAALVFFLVLTFSRRGYFTVVGASALLLWWSRRAPAKRVKTLLVLGAFLLAILVVLSMLPIGELIIGRSTLRLFDNPSFIGRQHDWLRVWSDVTQNAGRFFWGFGLGSTGPSGIRFNVLGATPVHSHYFLLWHQLGLVGLVLFLTVLAGTLIQGLRVAPRLRGTALNVDVWFAIVLIIALTLNGLLGTTFEAYPNDMLFWTAITMIGAGKRFVNRRERPPEKPA